MSCDELENNEPALDQVYYPLPTQWAESLKPLSDALSPTEVDHQSNVIRVVRAADLKCVAVIESGINWQAYAVEFGMGLASGAGSWVAGRVLDLIFPPTTSQLSQQAIKDIGNVVRNAIDDAFLAHYLREIEGISNALKTFDETGDERKLNEAEAKCDALLPHIRSYGNRGLGGFLMAANLHLVAVLAKAELNQRYRTTYGRLKVDYAAHGINCANQIRAHIESRVGHCRCRTQHEQGEGPTRICELEVDGRTVRWADGSDQDRVDRDCAAGRQNALNAATADIQRLVNPIVETCNSWLR